MTQALVIKIAKHHVVVFLKDGKVSEVQHDFKELFWRMQEIDPKFLTVLK